MNSDKAPKVSVVMSVYNGEKYLREAVDSILNQTFTDFEFIIVDDGSTDKSADVISSYNDPRIVLIQQANKGLAVALNVGIKAAKGVYIGRMDADDISHTRRLELQVDYMEKHKECVALGTETDIIDEDGNYIYTNHNCLSKEELNNQFPQSNPITHGSVMMRRASVLKCGGYREDAPNLFDDDLLWIDLGKLGYLDILGVPLYCYRIRPMAISGMSKKLQQKLREIRTKYYYGGVIDGKDVLELNKIRSSSVENGDSRKSYYHFRVGKAYLSNTRNLPAARKHMLMAVRYKILNKKAWFNLMLSSCPASMVSRWQRFRVK